ncbi:MAG TPA: hypothetical protein VK066_12600 [Chloroflexota bacterium]|nr:hypothetical protein [Chloroflexota bacterium]
MRTRRSTGIVPLVVAVSLLLWPLGGGAPGVANAVGASPDAPASLLHAGSTNAVQGQNLTTPIPDAGLQTLTEITVPGWTSANATTDILSFDPVRLVMYFPDRVNNAVDAIDTGTNTLLGMIPMPPDCVNVMTARGHACPSGVQVAPDLRKLLVTDRGSRIFIFDISGTPVPQSIQTTLTLPNGASGADELDYDPLNHRAYVNNGSGAFPPPVGPFETTVVDVVRNVVLGAIPQVAALEQPRFNPVDGFIYNNVSGLSQTQRIDPARGRVGEVVATFAITACPSGATGIDIDPVSDVAVLACGAPDPVPVLDLTTGTIRQTFPQITGADGMYFNNNTRRWYQANNSNTNPNADTCPVDTIDAGNLVPVVGVFGAAKGGGRAVSLIGVQCSVANGHSLGVDPIHNNVYVPGKAFPANGGPPGVAVFHDPSPSAQRPVNRAQADLQPLSGQIVQGQVTFQNQGRVVSASVKYISREAPSELVITTTVGNEVVRCADADPGRERDEGRNELAICQGHIIGAPLIRGVVLFGVAGKLFASGTIHRGAGEPDD